MEKIKANKVWITVIVIGVVIIGILLLMLNQQKQANLTEQEASYSASVKASSSSQVTKDQENVKTYAKIAKTLSGSVFLINNEPYFTKWSENDFKNWARSYNSLSDADKQQAKTDFGTSRTVENDSIDTRSLGKRAESIISGDYINVSYFKTVKDYNKAYPAVNPDDIIK